MVDGGNQGKGEVPMRWDRRQASPYQTETAHICWSGQAGVWDWYHNGDDGHVLKDDAECWWWWPWWKRLLRGWPELINASIWLILCLLSLFTEDLRVTISAIIIIIIINTSALNIISIIIMARTSFQPKEDRACLFGRVWRFSHRPSPPQHRQRSQSPWMMPYYYNYM